MLFYHGTKVEPRVILREGLKPCPTVMKYKENKDLEIRDIVERKLQHMFVYLTTDYLEAQSYALSGSNFEALIHGENCKVGYIYTVYLPVIALGEFRIKQLPSRYIIDFIEIKAKLKEE